MALILKQVFPLGRFHATRWNQNPFEDRFGEWPPSPWRLLRALAARWFQYSRETGDEDESLRNRLLLKLAKEVPNFQLPAATWRGPAIKQYHPTKIGWKKKKNEAEFAVASTTLVEDHYQAVPFDEPILWVWGEKTELDLAERNLLVNLLRRMLYFGRSESFCRIELTDQVRPTINCNLSADVDSGNPVLVAQPDKDLDFDALLASTDGDCVQDGKNYRVRNLLKERRIPPGTAWYYATIPARKQLTRTPVAQLRYPSDVRVVQFAVGGRVYPPLSQWIRVTERFRGKVLKEIAKNIARNRLAKFDQLPARDRDRYALLSGKMSSGLPLTGHQHAYFALYPDQFGYPTRLVVFRRTPFESEELAAMMTASESTLSWQPQGQDWQLRFVPLPFHVRPPLGLAYDIVVARTWKTITPFVSPGGRLHFRKNGRMRPGETPERLLEKLLTKHGYSQPTIKRVANVGLPEWMAIHESKQKRAKRREERTRAVLPGYRFEIQFPEPVSGPICVGHSCHFGLGLFVPK